ncbi:MAG: GNAT family N-acetyltransferase [Bacteroidota bacterium]|jgi:hypothetical protein|nr:GNAT family N-acetyltransferase [Bacteroidota bacterium]
MISYLRNDEIDRMRWDACLGEIPSVRPYALSWYLDIMSPGWDALVDDDYLAVFPLPRRKKYGISYVATPVFLQQLGLFSADGDRVSMAEEFISFMPEFYRLIDLCIGQEAHVPGYTVSPRHNYEIRLDEPYDKVWVSYMSDCRRNINIARRYPQDIITDVRPDEVIRLFRNYTAGKAGVIKDSGYSRLHRLMEHCITAGTGRILGVRSPKGKLLWGMFVIDTMGRTTMLFTAGSRKSRELRTSYLVIDHIIRSYAGTGQVLDFAGSSVPSIAIFMRSFGGEKTTYWRLYRNNLPWPVRLFK